jgi:hypothetical protein
MRPAPLLKETPATNRRSNEMNTVLTTKKPAAQIRFRRLPKLLELLDQFETEKAAADGVLPHPVSTLRADLARLIS